MKQKKELSILFVLIGLSLFLCFPFLNNYINIMDDMPFHLNRIMNLADNIKEGILIPSVYGEAIAGYGYANGLFYPDLFLYIPATLVAMGLNLIMSYGLFIYLITIVTGLTTFVSVKSIIEIKQSNSSIEGIKKDGLFTYAEKVSLLTTIVYLAFPYRLIDIYIRGALGEVLVFIFIPIVIWGIYEIFHKEEGNWKVLAIGMTGLLYSHIITLFLMAIVVLIFGLINYKKIRNVILDLLKATGLSLLLSSMFLLPMLEQMLSNEFFFNVHKPLGEIYENSFDMFSYMNQVLLLILNLLIIGLIVYAYKKVKNKDNKVVLTSILIGFYLCLTTTNFFPWELLDNVVPLIGQVQFPWRLFIFVGGLLGIANAIKILDIFERMTFSIPLLTTLLLSMTIAYTCINPIVELNDTSRSFNYVPRTEEIGKGEYLPSEFVIDNLYEKRITVKDMNDKDFSYDYNKVVNKATLSFNSYNNNLSLELPIVYYKGYKAYIDTTELEVYENDRGMVTINTDDFKEGTIFIEYKPTLIQIVSTIITLITLISFITISIISYYKRYKI